MFSKPVPITPLLLREKDAARAIEHIVGRVSDGPKAAALNQDCFFVKNFRRRLFMASTSLRPQSIRT